MNSKPLFFVLLTMNAKQWFFVLVSMVCAMLLFCLRISIKQVDKMAARTHNTDMRKLLADNTQNSGDIEENRNVLVSGPPRWDQELTNASGECLGP